MSCSLSDSHAALFEFPSRAADIDLSRADETELKTVLTQVRAAQRCLDGITIRIATRSDALAARGSAAQAAETLRGDGSVSAAQARREARRAEVAEVMPGVAAAIESGDISGEHVDAIARHTGGLTDEQQAALDIDTAIAQAKRLPPETFNRYVKRTVEAVLGDHGLGDTVTKQRASEFRHWFDHNTGMGRFAGSLDPERYEILANAVEQRSSTLAAGGDVEKNPNLAARALVDLVDGAEVGRDVRSRLPSLLVVVDYQTALNGPHPGSVRQTENGHDIAAASLARLACDAMIRRITLDETGVPINVGRKHRTATDAQWAAIKSLYSSCGWHGCDAPISWCQAHHITEWEHGGPTDLANLIPLCSQHHHRVHEGQWSIKLKPDRSLSIYRPNGKHYGTTETPTRAMTPTLSGAAA